METVAAQKNHKLILNNRKAGLVTGVLDVLSFNLNEILLETEQGMLMVRGTDLHVNRVNLEKGEIDLSGKTDIMIPPIPTPSMKYHRTLPLLV